LVADCCCKTSALALFFSIRGYFAPLYIEYRELIVITATNQKTARRFLPFVIAGTALAGVAAAVLIGMSVKGNALLKSETVFEHVSIAGVDVGGMTAAEAKTAVERSVTDKYAAPLEIRLPDRTLTIDPAELNVNINSDAAVAQAMAYGRAGSAFDALEAAKAAKKTPLTLKLDAALEMNTAYVQQILQDAAAAAARPLTQPGSKLDHDTNILTVTTGTDGVMLDIQPLYNTVITALQAGDLQPIDWEYTVTPCGVPDLDAMFKDLHTDAVDAYYDAENHVITAEAAGQTFDLALAKERLAETEPGGSFGIRIETVEPAMTAEGLNSQMFGQRLAEQKGPYYAGNTAKATNLRLACEAINGTILNPGEIFSFNGVVGERTKEKGYQAATIYLSGDKTGSDYGGGVCQVASVLYYTTLHLEVKQIERTPHVFTVSYVPLGMDAGIYWDSKQDYRFQNTLNHPIKIQARCDGSNVITTIWGIKENDNYVKMTYQILETYEPELVEKLDETKPEGYRQQTETPMKGYRVHAYRTLYDASGKVLEKTTIYSTYRKRDDTWIVGPGGQTPEEPPMDEGDVPTDPMLPDAG